MGSVYLDDKYAHTESTIASKKMFNASGVQYRMVKPLIVDIKK